MGFRCRWLAVRDGDVDAALETIGLVRVRERESDEPVYDCGHYAVVLPGSWVVVIGDGWDALHTVEPRHAPALSAGTDALHFYCDDTSMSATLVAHRDGERVWSLEYDGSGGVSAPVRRERARGGARDCRALRARPA